LKKQATVLYQTEADLGEGPVWMDDSNEILWVDINNGHVHCTQVYTAKDKIIYHGNKPSSITPISNEELLISDLNQLVVLNRITGKNHILLNLVFDTPNVRFNDGKADSNGNLWVGTLEMNITPGKGDLFLIDRKKQVTKSLRNVTISNGMTWSLDNKTMFYIDTMDYVVYAFDFNEKSEISNQRIVVKIPTDSGAPDGMTIDANGNLWIALWGGYGVGCFNPITGDLLDRIDVNAPHVSSCSFGGENLSTLFITTAREGLSTSQLQQYPESGSVFQHKMNVNGHNPYRFNHPIKK
jgi:sugar lactone lactonase YvrE